MGDARRVSEAALAPAARLLVDVRLGIVLVVALGALAVVGRGPVTGGLLLLLVVPGNLLLLMRWGREGGYLVTAFFTVPDAVVTVGVLAVGTGPTGATPPLVTAYALVSAFLISVVSGSRALWGWLVPVLMALTVLAVRAPGPWPHLLVLVAVLGLALLGRRMVEQVARVEVVAADLARVRALQASSEERIVLARDLHDTVAKSAAGVRMLSEVLAAELAEEGSAHARDAALLLEAADALSAESRAVLDELRVAPEGDLRLRLVHDVETWGRRLQLEVRTACEGRSLAASGELTWQAQRALGEMLSNIEKHARASHVRVRVTGTDDAPPRLLLEVEDDGVGLPRRVLEDPTNLRGSGHYGLCGMQERLASLGGRLSLKPRQGGGTRVLATIPVPQPSRERAGRVSVKEEP
ncbi:MULTISPECIES: ATP-binding protein [unclassified Actinomyces]|uniref:sensor histidine kinase n=1 Tax=unclassified Actinomyces TaxID=2609248 RepID=UPI002016BD9C|nr:MULTISPECIES: ATP-binding protein [unclassified Actinomyces]MCL3777073.1 hypothetical protein [Actinomyces sp. AC-20-1]MCL3790293.1 hypothetical protein [Actinomyces sp. 187325]MCL3793075.1 hypothetical protein [Actinomyces sp. 186855]MCL3793797.1 hypothetical protein [Actinomyces sp. 217892]